MNKQFEHLKNLPFHERKVKIWMIKADENNEPDSLYRLGHFYYNGYEGDYKENKNIEKSLTYFLKSYDLGYIKSATNIGIILYLKKEYERAFKYLLSSNTKELLNTYYRQIRKKHIIY